MAASRTVSTSSPAGVGCAGGVGSGCCCSSSANCRATSSRVMARSAAVSSSMRPVLFVRRQDSRYLPLAVVARLVPDPRTSAAVVGYRSERGRSASTTEASPDPHQRADTARRRSWSKPRIVSPQPALCSSAAWSLALPVDARRWAIRETARRENTQAAGAGQRHRDRKRENRVLRGRCTHAAISSAASAAIASTDGAG